LAPFTYADVTWSGPFPDTIPPGMYWIGWVIDPDNEIPNEWIEGNNSAYDAARQLTVIPALAGQVRVAGATTNIQGAEVKAYLSGKLKGTATTDAGGLYRITQSLPTGTYTVAAAKAGYISQIKTNVPVTQGSTTYVNFALERASLKGQVKQGGAATNIASATVTAYLGDELKATATTNAIGVYEIGQLAAGTYRVMASKPGYVRQKKWNIAVVDGGTTYVNFSLAISGKLKGQVKDKVSGVPIIGAAVIARKDGITWATGTTTAPWGIYEIVSDLPAGTYVVGASMTGYLGQTRKDIPVTAGATTYVNFNLAFSE
jgi:large repetitive protein